MSARRQLSKTASCEAVATPPPRESIISKNIIFEHFWNTICDKREIMDASLCHALLIVCISARTAALVITRVDRRDDQQLSIGILSNAPINSNSLQQARHMHTISDSNVVLEKGARCRT